MIDLRTAIANSRRRGSAPVDPNQWDATSLGTGIALSGSNLIVTRTGGGGYSSARSVGQCPATNDRYFTLAYAGGTGSPFQLCGIATAALSTSNYPGSDSTSWGYYQQTGQYAHGGATFTYGTAYTAGDVITVAYKGSTGQLFFRKNSTWQNSGNPLTGTGALTVATAAYFAAVGLYDSGAKFTADFTSTDADPLLVGFAPWVP